MNPLQLLETPLRVLLDFLHDNVQLSYGWAIVVLTVLVRTALLPLVIKQYRSMRQMQIVAPQLKELQRKYKGDRAKTQEELMKFYRENEINPFASCLPLVAQLPVFIALYYTLRNFDFSNTVDAGQQVLSFMWLIPDVSTSFTDMSWWSKVPLLAIYGLTQLLSTELSATPNMPDSQRRMMRFLPLGIVFFVVNFPVPAGLVVYWMATNLWTCGQQLVMRHRIGMHLAEEPATQTGKRSSRTAPQSALVEARGGDDDASTEGAGDEQASEGADTATGGDEVDGGATAERTSNDGSGVGHAKRTKSAAPAGGKRRQPRARGGQGRPGQKKKKR